MQGILNAIFNLIGGIADLIINGIITVILGIIDTILAPLDSFIMSIFPGFGSLLINISRLFSVIVAGPVNYFMGILNNFPYLKGAIRVSLAFDIVFFSSIGFYYLIQGTMTIVGKIKAMIH